MKLEELISLRDNIEQQFNNLSNPNWVNGQLRNLEGKFQILNDVINKLKEEANATGQSKQRSNSDSNQGGESLPRETKG